MRLPQKHLYLTVLAFVLSSIAYGEDTGGNPITDPTAAPITVQTTVPITNPAVTSTTVKSTTTTKTVATEPTTPPVLPTTVASEKTTTVLTTTGTTFPTPTDLLTTKPGEPDTTATTSSTTTQPGAGTTASTVGSTTTGGNATTGSTSTPFPTPTNFTTPGPGSNGTTTNGTVTLASSTTPDGTIITNATTNGSTDTVTVISTVSTVSTTPGVRKCGRVNDTEQCYYEGTEDSCDICEGVVCGPGKNCVKKANNCSTECLCTNIWEHLDEKGNCISSCTPEPCLNGGTCVPTTAASGGFTCRCREGYEGRTCQKVSNICLQPQPPLCPIGSFECEMHDLNNYTCNCAQGFWENAAKKCIQVDQTTKLSMHFMETPYSEIYNNISYPESQTARRIISAALEEMFAENLISFTFLNFTQGSLVANLELNLKLPVNGTIEANEMTFRRYILDCNDAATAANKKCFATLGKVFLPINTWMSEDERCTTVRCPANTTCEPVSDSTEATRCVCASGFEGYGSIVDSLGMAIEQCRDIDECSLNSTICSDGEHCSNTVGSFSCANPCSNVSCPGHASCVVRGSSFECQCSWIYAGSSCSFPWTLILLITTIIFGLITVAAGIFLFRVFRGGRAGSSNW